MDNDREGLEAFLTSRTTGEGGGGVDRTRDFVREKLYKERLFVSLCVFFKPEDNYDLYLPSHFEPVHLQLHSPQRACDPVTAELEHSSTENMRKHMCLGFPPSLSTVSQGGSVLINPLGLE